MPDLSSLPVVFLAFANEHSEGTGYLRHLPEEARALEQILTVARQAGLCELILRYNASAEDILRVFQSQEYRNRIAIFHYGGHANSYQLLLEAQSGGVSPVDATSAANFLGLQAGLQLVFLNGCSTEQHANSLLQSGVPVVIATSWNIKDEIAVKFAQGFYRVLTAGADIDAAYHEAIATVEFSQAGENRALRPVQQDSISDGRVYWHLYIREGAEQAVHWSLTSAANNPLFGLPALPLIDFPESPFRHLHRFQREHASVFFGRGYEIRDLYHRINNKQSAPILLVYGQSGVGKSSLLEAGLLPRLEKNFTVHVRRREYEQTLWTTLITAFGFEAGTPPSPGLWIQAEQDSGMPIVVVIDQVEEVFTILNPTHSNEWPDFIQGLQILFGRGSKKPEGKLILGFRKEWLPEIEEPLSKEALPRNRVFIEPLNNKGIIEAIQSPAHDPLLQQYYGLSLEKELAQTIAEDLLSDKDSPVAPVLQILLSKLWERSKYESFSRPVFTREHYLQLKRSGLLLGDFLDQELVLIEQQMPEAVKSGLLLDVLIYFTTPQGTSTEHNLSQLQSLYVRNSREVNELIYHCQHHYLLVDSANEQQNERSWRLGHDALAPLIKMRYEESDRPGQRARRILENRAADWRGVQAGIVLDEADLTVVEAGECGMRQWTADEKRLVDASRGGRQQRIRRNRRYRALALAGLLLIISTAVIAVWQWQVAQQRSKAAFASQNQAEHEQRLALSRQLAAQAELKLTSTPNDLVVGGLLAVEALKQAQTVEAYQAWSDTMSLLPRLGATLSVKPHEKISAMTYSPDGNFLAATVTSGNKPVGENTTPSAMEKSSWGVVKIWDTQTGELVKELGGAPRWLTVLAYSPDGQRLAAGGADGIITLWDGQTGKEQLKLQHNASIAAFNFQEQGHRLLSATRDDSGYTEGYWWNVDTGQKIASMALGELGGVREVETNKEGSLAATFGGDGLVKLWNIQNGKLLQQIPISGKGQERDLNLSQNGHWLAWADGDTQNSFNAPKSLTIWDIDKNKLYAQLVHSHEISNYGYSHDGKILAVCLKEAEQIWLWDVAAKSVLETIKLTPNESGITCNLWEFSPDDQLLVYYDLVAIDGSPGYVSLWDIKNNKLRAKLKHAVDYASSPIIFGGFSGDNRQIFTSMQIPPNRNEKFTHRGYTWDSQTGKLIKTEESDKMLCLKGPSSKGIFSVFQYRPDESVAKENLKICNNAIGQFTQEIKSEGKGFIDEGIISSDGTLLASTFGPDYTISIRNSKEQSTITLPTKGWIFRPRFINRNRDLLAQITDGHGGSNAAFIWDVHTGKERFQLNHYLVADELYFAENQPVIMTKVAGSTEVWDTATKRKLMSVNHGSEVKLLALGPNGAQWLSVADNKDLSNNTFVQIWDIASKREIFRLNHDKAINQAVYSRDGSRIVTASNDHTARLWDSQTGRELVRFQHEETVNEVFITPDNRYLITLTNHHNRHIWDLTTHKKLAQLPFFGDQKKMTGLTFDPNKQQLASLIEDSSITLMQLKNHGAEKSTISSKHEPKELYISPDGRRLLVLDKENSNAAEADWILSYDLTTGKELFSFSKKYIYGLRLAPNGKTFLTYDSDHYLRLWNTDNGQLIRDLMVGNDISVFELSYSPDSTAIAWFGNSKNKNENWYNSSGRIRREVIKGTVHIWNLESGKDKQLAKDVFVDSLSLTPSGLRFSSDGKFLAKVEGALNRNAKPDPQKRPYYPIQGVAQVHTWDVDQGKEVLKLADKELTPPQQILFSPDSKKISVTDFRNIKIFSLPSGKPIKGLSFNDFIELQEFSPDGHYLAFTRDHKNLHLIDFENKDSVMELNFPYFISATFSPDTKLLAIEGDKLSIWSIPDFQEIAQLPKNLYSSLSFTPDSRYLVTGHDDGKVRIWNLNQWDLIDSACQRLERNLTSDEWRAYLRNQPYQATCENLPLEEVR